VAGAGPAGLAVARTLADRGRRVLLLESGGFDVEEPAARLSDLEDAGPPRHRLGPARDRRFGGSLWYGRLVTFDPIDFEPRPWVPESGWPIAKSEIDARIGDAAAFLGLAAPDALAPAFWHDEPALRLFDGGGLSPRIHVIVRQKDLGQRHRSAVSSSGRLTALLHATVSGIDVDSSTRAVTALRLHTLGGRELRARARHYVLACGGLENAQLLLGLADEQPGVLGPSEKAVGRFLMDHPRVDGLARLHLDPAHPSYLALFRRLTEGPARESRSRLMIAAGLSDATQRTEQLLNACAFFYVESEPEVRAVRDVLDDAVQRGWPSDVGQFARGVPTMARAGLARYRRQPYKLHSLVMVEQLEQVPQADSRVTLGHERDSLGRRRLRLDWRVSADTIRTQRRLHRVLADRLQQQGVGRLESPLLTDPDFVPAYGDAAHPIGTTRMSSAPERGVVDADLRVHALRNLYVTGSSVFPTAGHANPTLSIVALSLRLAARLASERCG
jgi:choline dehydrogenase-like flavoprotein